MPVVLLPEDTTRLYHGSGRGLKSITGSVVLTFEATPKETWGLIADVDIECTPSSGAQWTDRVSMPVAMVLMRLAEPLWVKGEQRPWS